MGGCTPSSSGGADGSNVNMIGLSDARYDTSQYAGGTFYDSYTHTKTLIGTTAVIRVSLVLDSGWQDAPSGDQRLTLTDATVARADGANTFTPQPASFRTVDCKYVYNLATTSLPGGGGAGTYKVEVLINGTTPAANPAFFDMR